MAMIFFCLMLLCVLYTQYDTKQLITKTRSKWQLILLAPTLVYTFMIERGFMICCQNFSADIGTTRSSIRRFRLVYLIQ